LTRGAIAILSKLEKKAGCEKWHLAKEAPELIPSRGKGGGPEPSQGCKDNKLHEPKDVHTWQKGWGHPKTRKIYGKKFKPHYTTRRARPRVIYARERRKAVVRWASSRDRKLGFLKIEQLNTPYTRRNHLETDAAHQSLKETGPEILPPLGTSPSLRLSAHRLLSGEGKGRGGTEEPSSSFSARQKKGGRECQAKGSSQSGGPAYPYPPDISQKENQTVQRNKQHVMRTEPRRKAKEPRSGKTMELLKDARKGQVGTEERLSNP